MEELVSVEWLNNNLSLSNLVILDASPQKTVQDKNPSFRDLYIPNSRLFKIKENFTNKESSFPNTIPSLLQFREECRNLGINNNSIIIVYDNLGIYTSPRVWWLFKTMGHKNIRVLNGGIPEWINKGFETVKIENLNQKYMLGNLDCNFNKKYLVKYDDIIDNIDSNKFLLIDARSKGRFNGTEDEPRKYLKSGNIPNSVSIPYQSLLENGKFKSVDEINDIFIQKTNKQAELVFSCGSGMTACIVLLASEIAFKKSKFLYDGSWTEYAELKNLKKKVV
ncbi:MAG: thiosulfate/3-mercaptopyruvate sulfurtransferase [Gammaproteobacteria bacterium]|jgi:thiosulfate/3-mercaptopyruvate sulfurtransferase